VFEERIETAPLEAHWLHWSIATGAGHGWTEKLVQVGLRGCAFDIETVTKT